MMNSDLAQLVLDRQQQLERSDPFELLKNMMESSALKPICKPELAGEFRHKDLFMKAQTGTAKQSDWFS